MKRRWPAKFHSTDLFNEVGGWTVDTNSDEMNRRPQIIQAFKIQCTHSIIIRSLSTVKSFYQEFSSITEICSVELSVERSWVSLFRSNEHESWQKNRLECFPRSVGLEKYWEIFEHLDARLDRNFMLLCRAALRQRFLRHRLGRVKLARFSHNLRIPVSDGRRHSSALFAELMEFSALAEG